MKIETSPVLVLNNIIALRSKSYSFSYSGIQKSKQKGMQKAPNSNQINIYFSWVYV